MQNLRDIAITNITAITTTITNITAITTTIIITTTTTTPLPPDLHRACVSEGTMQVRTASPPPEDTGRVSVKDTANYMLLLVGEGEGVRGEVWSVRCGV